MNLRQILILFLILTSIFSCKDKLKQINKDYPISYEIQKSLVDDTAMVASARAEASIIAKDIMQNGGNAIDAAIATQFALSVCYPVAGNIGGGGFMIIRLADGQIEALDFREKAPLLATRDMYLDSMGNAITNKSRYGSLAVGVPGAVDGMVKAFEKHSKLNNWKKLVQPAIDLALNGILISARQATLLNQYQSDFSKYNTQTNEFIKDQPWVVGDLLIQKDLAHSLTLIRDKGRSGFYKGETADKIVAEMKRSGGLISLEDLSSYDSKWRTPITTNYKGHKIISMPPPSSGGIALAQLLGMIEPYDIASLGFHTAASIHLMVEAERRVYADRSKHLGDSDFYPVPIETLLDSTYIAQRFSNFNPKKATPSKDLETSTIEESTQTTHYSIIDPDGNAVSITTTLNGHYGSKLVVGGAGFLLNNEMDDFSTKPGTPNMFGLLGAEANKIEAGKRMLSSMTPTIVEKDGKYKISLGTPGGATIITSVFQTIVNIVDYNMTAKKAVDAPRFHHQWKPDLIYFEANKFQSELLDSLRAMGHDIDFKSSIGRVEAILRNNEKIEGAADPRGDDDVRGF